MSSTINNLTQRSPIDGTEYLVLATSGANWKAQSGGQSWVFGDLTIGNNHTTPNTVTVTGTGSGGTPIIAVTGTDTNIAMQLNDHGLGSFIFNSNSKTVLQMYNGDANVVNNFVINGGDSGQPCILQTSGTDADVAFLMVAKGAGAFKVQTNSATALNVVNPSSLVVNNLKLSGSISTSPVTINAEGSDTDIGVEIVPKGAGLLQLGNTASFSADGTVATVLGSLGPAGSNTTVQEWLTIKNSAGTTRYIPCF